MTAPLISIAAPKTGTIPPCTPHLMPFHIAYTGPAPVSTYFRVTHPKSGIPIAPPVLVEDNNKRSVEQSDSQTTLVAAESQQTLANDVDMLTLSESTSSTTNNSNSNLNSLAPQGDEKHLTAAFRGRTVRGLAVDLPEGYTGLVLSSPSSSTASSTSTSASKARATRNSKYFHEDSQEGEEDREEERPTKKLEPTGRFSSFTLWNADIPVDEGRDEYLRSLTEWTRLAAVVSLCLSGLLLLPSLLSFACPSLPWSSSHCPESNTTRRTTALSST